MKQRFYFLLIILVISACSESTSEVTFVKIPSGLFFFGSEVGMEHEGPAVPCNIDSFELSTTEISNAQFERFVEETGYVTDAEKWGGMVFDGEWKLIKQANWRSPQGKKVVPKEWKHLPVVQVSYADAMAYCDWSGYRLPSETEWEYAAKMGKSSGKKMNVTSAKAPHPKVANVTSFGGNKLGIYHQSGNVWEWCLDVYNSEIHDKRALLSTTDPFKPYQGRSFDPEKINSTDTLRVIKGGSFLCQAGFCAGYRPEARQSAEQHQGYFHIGFRVVNNQR